MNDYETEQACEVAQRLSETALEFATHAPAYTDIRTTFDGLRVAGDAIFYLSSPTTTAAVGFGEAVIVALRAAITKPAIGVDYSTMSRGR